jgi:hypothetical protein
MTRSAVRTLACLILLVAPARAMAVRYPPGPGGTCPDSLRIDQIQNPLATCHPAVPDTVNGVRGVVTGLDTLATGFGFYMQNTSGGAYGGVIVFTGATNYQGTVPGSPSGGHVAIGDSVVVYGSVQEFPATNGETEIEGPDHIVSTDDIVVRRIATGHALPPFHGVTPHEVFWRTSVSSSTAEPWEGCLVVLRGPVTVTRRAAPGAPSVGLPTFGNGGSFLCVSASFPNDTVLVDESALAGAVPPAVSATVDSVRGILTQRSTDGISSYRIQARDAGDVYGTLPPNVADVFAVSSNQVRVYFDRNVTQATAQTVANYQFSPAATVTSATLLGNPGRVVQLTVSGMSGFVTSQLTVSNIRSAATNTPMPASQTVSFVTGILSPEQIQAPAAGSLQPPPCVDRSAYAGTGGSLGPRVTVAGTATGQFGATCFIGDDVNPPRGGVLVFAPPEVLVEGHRYLIGGEIQEFSGVTEFGNVAVVIDQGFVGTVPPTVQTVAVLRSDVCDSLQTLQTGEDYEGSLVQVQNVTVPREYAAGASFVVRGTTADDTILVVNPGGVFDPDSAHVLDITGDLNYVLGRFQIQPRRASDIVDHAVNRAQAMALVTAQVIIPSPHADSLVGFMYHRTLPDSTLPAGTVLSDRDSSFVTALATPGYLFWLDDTPDVEWFHPSTFALVGRYTGQVQVFESESWPVIDNHEYLHFTMDGNASPDRFYGGYVTTYVEYDSVSAPAGDPTSWGLVVIGGNINGDAEKKRRRNDARRLKEILCDVDLGPRVDPGHVTVLSGINDCGATKQNVCDELANMPPCDKLFYVYLGHGLRDGKSVLNNETNTGTEYLTYEELVDKLLLSGAKEVCVLIISCYSGTAIHVFETRTIERGGKKVKLKGVLLTSSSDDNTTNAGLGDGCPFVKALLACMKDPFADLNKDGHVSLVEGEAWAKNHSSTVAKDDPEGALLGDGLQITFPPPTHDVSVSSADNAGNLTYTLSGIYYKVIQPGTKKDDLVCRRTLYAENPSSTDHKGLRPVRVVCVEARGTRTTLTTFTPNLKAKEKICFPFDIPGKCVKVVIEPVTPGHDPGLAQQSTGLASAVVSDDRSTIYAPGEFVFQDFDVPGLAGHNFTTALVESIPGWHLKPDPAAFTLSTTLDSQWVVVRGDVPASPAGGNVCLRVADTTALDTTGINIHALVFGVLGAPIAGGATHTHRALEAPGISVTSGAATLTDSRIDLEGASSCAVGPAGSLALTRAVVRPDSGAAFTCTLQGHVTWEDGLVVQPTTGLRLLSPTGAFTGGGVLSSLGDGLYLTGNLVAVPMSFFLVDSSAQNGLVCDGATGVTMRWVRILTSGLNDCVLINNSNATLVDAAFDDARVSVQAGSSLTRAWATDFLVTTPDSTPVQGTRIVVTDAFGTTVAVDTLGPSGLSRQFDLVQYRQVGATRTSYTPHQVAIHYGTHDSTFALTANQHRVVEVRWGGVVTGVPPAAPRFAFESPRPNPSAGLRVLRYSLPRDAHTRLAIYDAHGREVARLVDGLQTAGEHVVPWGTGRLAPGLYFARLTSGDRVAGAKLVVLE